MIESSKAKAWLWDLRGGSRGAWEHRYRPGMLATRKREVGGYDATEGWTG